MNKLLAKFGVRLTLKKLFIVDYWRAQWLWIKRDHVPVGLNTEWEDWPAWGTCLTSARAESPVATEPSWAEPSRAELRWERREERRGEERRSPFPFSAGAYAHRRLIDASPRVGFLHKCHATFTANASPPSLQHLPLQAGLQIPNLVIPSS